MKKIKSVLLATVLLGSATGVALANENNIKNKEQVVNNDKSSKITEEVKINTKINFSEITSDSVKVSWFAEETFDQHFYTNYILETDQGTYKETLINTPATTGDVTFNGLKSGVTHSNVRFGLYSEYNDYIVWLANDLEGGETSFTTEAGTPELTTFMAESVGPSDLVQFSFNLHSAGRTITNAEITCTDTVDPSITTTHSITPDEGFNNERINIGIYGKTIESKISITYNDGTSDQTIVQDFPQEVTTGDAIFIQNDLSITDITTDSATINWDFTTEEGVDIDGITIEYTPEGVIGAPVVIDTGATTPSGSYTITELNPNSLYSNVSLTFKYNTNFEYKVGLNDFITAPTAPTLVTGELTPVDSSTANFTWTLNTEGVELISLALTANIDGALDTYVITAEDLTSGSVNIENLQYASTYTNINLVVDYMGVDGKNRIESLHVADEYKTGNLPVEIELFRLYQTSPTTANVSWILGDNGNSIQSIELLAKESGTTDVSTTLTSTSIAGNEEITGLTPNTTYSDVTLKVTYKDNLDVVYVVTGTTDDLVMNDGGPAIENFVVEAGNSAINVSYNINADPTGELAHTITKVELVGFESTGTGVNEVSIDLGTELTMTNAKYWGLNTGTIYSDVRLKVTYDDGIVKYSDGTSFSTGEYIENYVAEPKPGTYIWTLIFDNGLDEISSIEIDDAIDGSHINSTDEFVNSYTFTHLNPIKVTFTINDPSNTQLEYVIDPVDGIS